MCRCAARGPEQQRREHEAQPQRTQESDRRPGRAGVHEAIPDRDGRKADRTWCVLDKCTKTESSGGAQLLSLGRPAGVGRHGPGPHSNALIIALFSPDCCGVAETPGPPALPAILGKSDKNQPKLQFHQRKANKTHEEQEDTAGSPNAETEPELKQIVAAMQKSLFTIDGKIDSLTFRMDGMIERLDSRATRHGRATHIGHGR
ncbi:hypothetical protein NDU88_002706 [Pleurodeles waltl]|uniref:Uncharacterized protein n=1 Tax=Pleurodeles waltl TaxID=8319 RepID=A0AAV7M8Y9_PLEWA|nr:hypothetical protein NDU88_002706 [Pleurodeles waltl]